MSGIVKDSSIWQSTNSKPKTEEPALRAGIVRDIVYNNTMKEIFYSVEVTLSGNRHTVPCRLMTSIGGVFNYEDITLRSFKHDNNSDVAMAYNTKPGDRVVVAFMDGNSREGIIVGGLKHEGRDGKYSPSDGPQRFNTFNGIDQETNKDGEYSITFNGIPTNIGKLSETPKNKIPKPSYNQSISGSFFKFDKVGSIHLNDMSSSGAQFIVLNKPSGTISIVSGPVSLILDKNAQSINTVSKTVSSNAADSYSITTKQYSCDATNSAKIKSPKIAFGSDSVELLDSIIKLIDALGKVKVYSPVGPCIEMKRGILWADVEKIKANIKSIKGTL